MAIRSHLIAGLPRLGPLPVKALTRETNDSRGGIAKQRPGTPGRPN